MVLQVLEHEQAYLAALPSAQMYEKSFMHRDTVTQVAVAQDQDFLITGSIDGHVKFWKKTPTGIEFAKHYRAHVGSLDGMMHFHFDHSLLAWHTQPSSQVSVHVCAQLAAALQTP